MFTLDVDIVVLLLSQLPAKREDWISFCYVPQKRFGRWATSTVRPLGLAGDCLLRLSVPSSRSAVPSPAAFVHTMERLQSCGRCAKGATFKLYIYRDRRRNRGLHESWHQLKFENVYNVRFWQMFLCICGGARPLQINETKVFFSPN